MCYFTHFRTGIQFAWNGKLKRGVEQVSWRIMAIKTLPLPYAVQAVDFLVIHNLTACAASATKTLSKGNSPIPMIAQHY